MHKFPFLMVMRSCPDPPVLPKPGFDSGRTDGRTDFLSFTKTAVPLRYSESAFGSSRIFRRIRKRVCFSVNWAKSKNAQGKNRSQPLCIAQKGQIYPFSFRAAIPTSLLASTKNPVNQQVEYGKQSQRRMEKGGSFLFENRGEPPEFLESEIKQNRKSMENRNSGQTI
ncbi:hypothetical protein [uncultured Allobaculum sp.]|uniref:hypothetical protein n=1 Tax=uncultured Allobaculum sp. TaxID=1187017 RepID=UPI00258BCB51|nr:hypothetical protein [uncultured Allobaculum sp.]